MLRPSRDIVLRSGLFHVLRTGHIPIVLQRLVSGLLAGSHQREPVGNTDRVYRLLSRHVLCGLPTRLLRRLQRLYNELRTSLLNVYGVCPREYVLNVHRQLRAGTMQHLQLVHNFVCSGM